MKACIYMQENLKLKNVIYKLFHIHHTKLIISVDFLEFLKWVIDPFLMIDTFF